MASILGTKAVGSIVKIKENGTPVEYIVVHQGLPDASMYDASCNGTWLLRKNLGTRMEFDTSDLDYQNSDVHLYLNGTFIGVLDNTVQSKIKQVKIPHIVGNSENKIVESGANGLSCKIFLLSAYEVGFTTNDSSAFTIDGTKLSYFIVGVDTEEAKNRRKAVPDGGGTGSYWLRSGCCLDDRYIMAVTYEGHYARLRYNNESSIRPAMILPSSMTVNDSGLVDGNTAPSTPGSINIPAVINAGDTITVSWSASTDAEGNLSGYKLEKSTNGGGSWSQIYQGSARSKTDTISGITQVMYRVKAYDAYGLESGYRTSGNVSVNNKPTISCSNGNGSNIGEKNSDFSVSYTVNDADNNSVTVTETVDSVVIRTYTATLGSATNLSVAGETFMTLPNGSHSLKISASDGKTTVEHNLTFTKNVTSASVTLKNNIPAASIKVCALSISGSIPSDATLQVLVTNNANDTSPTWEDCTTAVKNGLNYVFTNPTATNGFAFNFKVSVSRGSSGVGGHITSIQGAFQ